MKTNHLIYLLGISMLFFTCSSSSSDDVNPDPDPGPTTEVTYDDDVKAIINSNCTSCHGATPTNGAPTSYTTYNQVKNDADKIISRINNAGSPMPPTGLMAQSLRDKIQQWKDDGLLEN